jgi:hypothetical protein
MAKRRGWIISASVLREAVKLADEVSAWIAARDAAWRQASASKLEASFDAGGYQAGGRSLGLDRRTGRRLAPGVGFDAGAAERAVSLRRKTIRAVITRTIIDGSVVAMREFPVFSMASLRRV